MLGLPWLRSVDVKLFIQKKEIYISNIKKEEVVSQILCSTTSSEKTHFEANIKNQIDTDELLKEEDIDNFDTYNSDEESEEELFDQDF